jgi:integrase
MAVVPRKRKSGLVYYAVNAWQGRQASELVGTSKREAEIRDRAMKREIADGAYHPKSGSRAVTLRQYAETWCARRTNASAKDEARHVRLYVATRDWLADKRLDEVKPVDIDRLVQELRDERKPDGSRRLSDKTIANALGVLKLIFSAAIRADICVRQPVVLEPGVLKRRPSTEKETYTAGDVAVLTRHHAIPWPIRVLNALCLFAGLREGEACGRRWRDLDTSSGPLAALLVRDQYDGRRLKTDRPRLVPVHPELAAMLSGWQADGFELYTGRQPKPDDFIVPNVHVRRSAECHSRSSYYKAFIRYAEVAGVRTRSLHATRHTFISLCRRGGARKDVLERVTHNARGDIVDRYTHFDWQPLCEAVLCLRIDVHPTLHSGSGSSGESPQLPPAPLGVSRQDSAPEPVSIPGSIPGASTTGTAKLGFARKPRQEKRQESAGYSAELRAVNRRRRRRLLSLSEADPEAAGPGLALCRALDDAYRVGADEHGSAADLLGSLRDAAERVFGRVSP